MIYTGLMPILGNLPLVLAQNSEDEVANSSVAVTATETSNFIQKEITRFSFFQKDDLFVKVIAIVIIIAVAFFIITISHRIMKRYIASSNNGRISSSQATTAHVIYSLFRFVVIAFGVIVVLDIIGVNVTGFVAGLGIVGAIGGLAVQDLLKDLIAGTNIATEQYFAIGDVIECKGYVGEVVSLSMRSTKIKTYDGSIVTIQNHLIDSVRMISQENKISIPLSYDLDRKQAFDMMEHLVKEIEKIPEVTRALTYGIISFEDSSINYGLKYYCNQGIIPMVAQKVNVVIITELDKAGISIPFNQLDIHTYS